MSTHTSTHIKRDRGYPSFALGVVLAALVGISGGLGAVFFRWLIISLQNVFFTGGAAVLPGLGRYYIILVPAAGGILVGLLITFGASEAKGHGVPEVMYAMAEKGGRIRPRVVAVKTLASALCMGSGGSVGREGPIVQIGSAIGSSIGQLCRLPTAWVRTLVGCGAAAGIAATFNAPLGGVFFTMELLMPAFASCGLHFIVISSIAGNLTANLFFGSVPAFDVVHLYALNGIAEIPFYIVLGIVTGLAGTGFIKLIHLSEDAFESMKKVPEWIKPALGGILVGCIGLYSMDLLGVGYGVTPWKGLMSMDEMFRGTVPLVSLLLLLLLKMTATSLTIGSGGSGGVFAPSLFLGAAMGGIVGLLASRVVPTAGGGAFAVVGAAAFFAAVSRAPITSVIMILELTRNYKLVVPVILAVLISTSVLKALSRETIYTEKLMRRGIDLVRRARGGLIGGISLATLMSRRFPRVSPDTTIEEALAVIKHRRNHGLPVVDAKGELLGIVALADILRSEEEGIPKMTPVTGICTPFEKLILAYPDQTLVELMSRVVGKDIGQVPVVDPFHERTIVGLMTKKHLVRAWSMAFSHGEHSILGGRSI